MHYFPNCLHILKSGSYMFQCVCSDVFYSSDELTFTIKLAYIYIYIYFFTFSIHAVKLKVLTYILIIPQRSAKNPKYYPEVKSTFIHVSNNFLMNGNVLIAAQGVGKTDLSNLLHFLVRDTLLRRITTPRRPVNTCVFFLIF